MSLYPSFARPTSLKQAAELLGGLSTGASIIAGGQELMPSVNYGVLTPTVYVDIGGLPELKGIREDDGVISIGALTVHRDLQTNPLVSEKLPLLAYAATKAGGGRQVHNRATLGGNLVSMHPLYDLAPSLLALEADVEFIKGDTTRRVAFADLIKDTSHGLGSEAILTRVLIKPMAAGAGYAYEKLKMSGGAYGSANAAAIVGKTAGKITFARLILGAVSERWIDASQSIGFVVGEKWTSELAEHVERRAVELVKTPLSDQQGEAGWRQAMAGVVARRALGDAVAAAA
jgi:aerobic carbon-monoxide dehydrogenase medium subunit